MLALGAVGVVELALVPHVIPRLDHPVQFIVRFPLSLRLQQVPVAFAMSTLYQELARLGYGLIGAAVVAAAAIGLLVAGAGRRELRGRRLAAALAAAVLLVPLALALAGHDDYIARGLMPALGAAGDRPRRRLHGARRPCRRARCWRSSCWPCSSTPGSGSTVIGASRNPTGGGWPPPWARGRAARGRSSPTTGCSPARPLSVYLPGVPWSGPGRTQTPALVTRVRGRRGRQRRADPSGALPAGMRAAPRATVDGYRVVRFGLGRPWTLSPTAIGARAPALLGPSSGDPVVMIQRPAA